MLLGCVTDLTYDLCLLIPSGTKGRNCVTEVSGNSSSVTDVCNYVLAVRHLFC